jgi:hypothetical protein
MQSANGFSRLSEVYFALCKAVDTPVSLGLWLRFKHGEHKQLAEFSLRPEWYCSAWQFHLDYICSEYLSKYIGLDTGVDKSAVALRGFATYEESCRKTNSRIREGRFRGCSPRVESVLHTTRRKIANLLMDYRVDLWLDRCKWGPGATFSLKGENATLDDKIREDQMSITATAMPYFRKLISDDYAWLSSRGITAEGPCCLLDGDFKVVEGCRVTTVLKNAKTDRTIAIEPTLNQFLQGGIGNYIRDRLKRYGIDLNDQTRNQYGAETALKRRLATVDLKAASDTVSKELVYELLPIDWAMTMDDLRSKKYRLPDGSWHNFEKFSTMGNGFTFELESLIFWALSESVRDFLDLKGHVLVYGDDIIIHEAALPLLLEVFEYCGFTVNTDKTHFNSLFRESCGKHYFGGFDVTPIYQKEVPDVLEELYRMANRIRRLAFSMAPGIGCMGILRNPWLAAIRNLRIRHAIPIDSQDDDGVALPYDELEAFGLVLSRRNTNGGLLAIKVPVLSFRPKRRRLSDSRSLLAYWLRFTPAEPFNDSVAVRRRGKYASRRRWYHVNCRSAPWV